MQNATESVTDESSALLSQHKIADKTDLRLQDGIGQGKKVVIVDLNNFATFPTLAIGLLVASLRKNGFSVEVLCPLAHDVPAAERERQETRIDDWMRRLHLAQSSQLRGLRDLGRYMRQRWRHRPHDTVLRETATALDKKPDLLLLSAYLEHHPSVVELGKLAAQRNVPMLLGGPVFNLDQTIDAWRNIPGLDAIIGGESDLDIAGLAAAAITSYKSSNSAGKELLEFAGVVLPDGRRSKKAPPLFALDETPVPDFTDFPWDKYRVRVLPVMASRGCQWAKCVFCSDVHSVNGRKFRSRSIEHVLQELEQQADRHHTANFLFLDLKLNSNPNLLRGIVNGIQKIVPGAQWIGTVHVDRRDDNGLSKQELDNAVTAGMRRVSFGLETGSQRLLDAMQKGASVETNSAFIRNAHSAGLSIRCTMFRGFPGETADDLIATEKFLEDHSEQLDRIRFNDLSIHEGTPMYDALTHDSNVYPGLKVIQFDRLHSRMSYAPDAKVSREYKQALQRVLRIVHQINKRELRQSAAAFDGLM